jgi:hypothetical protein
MRDLGGKRRFSGASAKYGFGVGWSCNRGLWDDLGWILRSGHERKNGTTWSIIKWPSINSDGRTVNNQGIVTQGQFGNNTIINPAFPNYSGTLTPKATLLFSPNKDEASYIPKLQFGTSNVIYGAKAIGLESPYGSLLFPALSERQFKIESIDGKIKGHLEKYSLEAGRSAIEVAAGPV